MVLKCTPGYSCEVCLFLHILSNSFLVCRQKKKSFFDVCVCLMVGPSIEVRLQTYFQLLWKDFDVLKLHTWVEESHWNTFSVCSVLFDRPAVCGQMSEESSPRLIWGHVYLAARRASLCCSVQTFFRVALYEGEVTKRQNPNRQPLIKASGWTGKAGLAPARQSRIHLCFRLLSSDFFCLYLFTVKLPTHHLYVLMLSLFF